VAARGEGFVEDGEGCFGLVDGLEFLGSPEGVFGFGCVVRHCVVGMLVWVGLLVLVLVQVLVLALVLVWWSERRGMYIAG